MPFQELDHSRLNTAHLQLQPCLFSLASLGLQDITLLPTTVTDIPSRLQSLLGSAEWVESPVLLWKGLGESRRMKFYSLLLASNLSPWR